MANKEHLAILKKGVGAWNRWRDRNLEIRPDLGEADLSMHTVPGRSLHGFENVRPLVDLSGINFENADLSGANLQGVSLLNARLVGADLRSANLSESMLGESDLSEADLLGANLRSAELIGTTLRNAELGDADLSYSQLSQAIFDRTRLVKTSFMGSNMVNTLFASVDLREAGDLETVNHLGPSSIGVDTIYESQGMIPEAFLRGAGVPEPFIVQMKALVAAMEPIQFYSCFISYSSKDQEFAERLYADLQSRNVRCWFAPHHVQGGKKLHEQIDEAIRVHEKLLLILSPDSMWSEWVKTELAKARKREVRENRRVLFPMRLCSFEELSRTWERGRTKGLSFLLSTLLRQRLFQFEDQRKGTGVNFAENLSVGPQYRRGGSSIRVRIDHLCPCSNYLPMRIPFLTSTSYFLSLGNARIEILHS